MRGLKLLAARLGLMPEMSLWSWATVTDDSPLRVQLDSEDAALPITPDTLAAGLLVGDRVWVQLVTNANPARRHRRIVVHGKAGGFTRTGITLRRTSNQSFSSGSADDIDWSVADFESPNMWDVGTPATVTLPSAGRWAFDLQTEWASAVGSGRAFISIEDSTGAVYRLPYAGTGEQYPAFSWTMPVAAGLSFTCRALQSSGGAINLTSARLHCYKIGA